jgi:hypothetical protein
MECSMGITLEEREEMSVVALDGSIDISAGNADQFKQSFREEAREILVDLEAALLELNENREDAGAGGPRLPRPAHHQGFGVHVRLREAGGVHPQPGERL